MGDEPAALACEGQQLPPAQDFSWQNRETGMMIQGKAMPRSGKCSCRRAADTILLSGNSEMEYPMQLHTLDLGLTKIFI